MNINEEITALREEIAENKTVSESAAVALRGINGRIQAAVTKALENGATAEQLAPLTELRAELDAQNASLAAAVAENTGAE